MKRWARLALAIGLLSNAVWRSGIGAFAEQAGPQTAGDISPAALAQIDALIAEKESRTPAQRKIDSQLLYELRMEAGQPVADGIDFVAIDLPYADDGHVVADVAALPGSDLRGALSALGVEVLSTSPDGSTSRVHFDIDQAEAIAALPDVLFVQPKQAAAINQEAPPATTSVFSPTGQGSRSSEGDVTHLAFAARGTYHVDGTGVKIGVLSNGVSSLAASQAAGDLGPVIVLAGQAGSGDEGTAMLEIIHDLAPGAQLYFATAFNGITSFAQNIRALRAAGCDIIVDDVMYFVETPFQDGQTPGVASNTSGGAVTQAVNDVTADGALYFSSAGNSGNVKNATAGTWEGDFIDGGAFGAAGNRLHSFVGQNFDLLTAGTQNFLTLHWSDPLGGSANDYDLFVLNSSGTSVIALSTNIQNGAQDPYEQISGQTPGIGPGARIVVVKKGAAAPRFLHLDTNRGRLSIATAGQTHGHNQAANALSTAATPVSAPFSAPTPAGPFPASFRASSAVETFSSDGPRRIFFQGDGTAYTAGNFSSTGGLLRQKPDITAGDGVSVTGVGGFPSTFFGTSAAATHAAAIAALVRSAGPALTAAQIRTILKATAIDIETPGDDPLSGAGIVMAQAAVGATGAPGTAFVTIEDVQVSDNPGNGNGRPEAGEGARLTLTLKNYGVAPATGITGAMATSSPGISITQPATLAFPDLAPAARGAAESPLLFTVASDYACAGVAKFDFTVTYGGGTDPASLGFAIPIGLPTSVTISETPLGSPPTPVRPPVAGATTGFQSARVTRDGIASACGMQKPFPGLFAAGAVRKFDAYAFDTCGTERACVTVSLASTPTGSDASLFASAYQPTFDPFSPASHYRADAGTSNTTGGFVSFGFDVDPGPQTFVVDVNEVNPGLGKDAKYTLSVAGACLGTCAPPNHVPVAKTKNVTVSGDAACKADASIDDGSSDADGDPLTMTQMPRGPYPLGLTPVLLTVTDTKGAASQATGSVTVVDDTAPAIVCPDPIIVNNAPGICAAPVIFGLPTATDNCSVGSVSTNPVSGSMFPVGTTSVTGTALDGSGNRAACTLPVTVVDNERPSLSSVTPSPAVLWPPNHGMVDVIVSYDAADNCGSVSCILSVASNEAVNGVGDGNTAPDWQVLDAHHVRLRAERAGGGNGRVYTITARCTDAAGNTTVKRATVVVPHDQ